MPTDRGPRILKFLNPNFGLRNILSQMSWNDCQMPSECSNFQPYMFSKASPKGRSAPKVNVRVVLAQFWLRNPRHMAENADRIRHFRNFSPVVKIWVHGMLIMMLSPFFNYLMQGLKRNVGTGGAKRTSVFVQLIFFLMRSRSKFLFWDCRCANGRRGLIWDGNSK